MLYLERLGDLHDVKQKDYGTDGDPFANVRGCRRVGYTTLGWCYE